MHSAIFPVGGKGKGRILGGMRPLAGHPSGALLWPGDPYEPDGEKVAELGAASIAVWAPSAAVLVPSAMVL